ncbi:MAG: restriction endonuclease subunit S [Gammaproteobacteria bacterium]|nr:restriction endonuclease subunit S [Gammaproteobacteria bacterium]
MSIDEIKSQIAIGPFGSRMKSDCYVSKGIKVVRGTNLTNGRGLSGEFVFITPEKAVELGSSNLAPGDLVFPHRGSIGEVGIIPDDGNKYVLSSSLMKLTCHQEKADPNFIFYFFKSSIGRHELLKNASQVGTPGIGQPLTSLKSIKLKLPSLAEQKTIAEILKALDDRIAALRETNLSLESIAQTLFKSWFIDFDPVRAKAEAREPEGMDAETAALFPDDFEESCLDTIPKGWKFTSLGEVSSYINRGISPKYTENVGITVINQKCIRDNIVDLTKARKHDSVQRKVEGRELLVGDVLINSTGVGTLGRVAQILSIDEPLIVDSHVTVVRAGESLTWNYLGLALSNRQAEIEQLGEGSTGQTELSRAKLAKLKFIIPMYEILQAFDLYTLSLRNKFSANLKKIETLATLRDSLLPRLISGQLDVSEKK